MPQTILPDHRSDHQSRAQAGKRSSPTCPRWRRTRELHALGRAILELRARRGLSQEQLGAESGLHRNYIGAMERGEINPTFQVLLKLTTGLRIPLAELIDVYERQHEALLPAATDQPRTHDR